MDEIKKGIHRTIDILEQDNRGVQLGCYSVALVGLSIAIRRVRPFSKFRKPSDIPNHFIQERKELTGVVERIDPNGALLMVRHRPLVPIPGLPDSQLPVKISGVKVTPLGIHWLQTIVTGNEIKFVPLVKDQNFVQCQVMLPQIHHKKARVINVGESLVKVGFGYVSNIDKKISRDRNYMTYHHRLQSAEIYALRKKLGVYYYLRPMAAGLTLAGKSLRQLFWDVYRHVVQIPKMPAS